MSTALADSAAPATNAASSDPLERFRACTKTYSRPTAELRERLASFVGQRVTVWSGNRCFSVAGELLCDSADAQEYSVFVCESAQTGDTGHVIFMPEHVSSITQGKVINIELRG